MQSKNQIVIVQSRSDLDKKSESTFVVSEFIKSYRLIRAFKALALFWAIAIFCILIPMLHFVLVPAFLLVGIFMFFQQMGIHYYLIGGQIRCPSCEKEFDLKPVAFDWPKRDICPYCRADLTISAQISS